MPQYDPSEETADLTVLLKPKSAPKLAASEDDGRRHPLDEPVQIPVQDNVQAIPELNQAVEQAIALREKLANEANTAEDVWSRSSEKQLGESDHAHQERIKREFEAAVMAVRRQQEQAPMPPMGLPKDHPISKQTQLEMAAGRKQSDYWKEQQKLRPLPNVKEIQAAGSNTPVFRPGEYMHEKGGVEGKNTVTQQTPTR
jgi:hypothetical protein